MFVRFMCNFAFSQTLGGVDYVSHVFDFSPDLPPTETHEFADAKALQEGFADYRARMEATGFSLGCSVGAARNSGRKFNGFDKVSRELACTVNLRIQDEMRKPAVATA